MARLNIFRQKVAASKYENISKLQPCT